MRYPWSSVSADSDGQFQPGTIVIARGGWSFTHIEIGDLLMLIEQHDIERGDRVVRWTVMKANGNLATISWLRIGVASVQELPGHGTTTSPTNEAS